MESTDSAATALDAMFLGALQGVTEFLPVSSSGHLVLFQQFFEVAGDDVLFDLVLHLGTLAPVLWFYRESLLQMIRAPFVGEGPMGSRSGVHLMLMLIAASVPTAMIGLLFQDTFEALFQTPGALVFSFGITGAVLLLSGKAGIGTIKADQLTVKLALILGIAQGIAITPGISRSGSTIAVALLLGLDREFAAKFSFLMSIPAILGAVILKFNDAETAGLDTTQLTVGSLTALITGYLALVALVKVVKIGKFQHFSWYCFAMAIIAGIVAFF